MKRIGHLVSTGILLAFFAPVAALAQTFATTTVQGTVFAAGGAPVSGTLQLSWPAFTTAAGQAVAAGRTTVSIGADGFFSVNLAPNIGAMPAGLYYIAIYHLADGTTSTEYWTVPATASATLAQVRAVVMPAAQAVQAVNKAYVDQAIAQAVTGQVTLTGGTLTGPLFLAGDPTQPMQAADKHYVDDAFAGALPIGGGVLQGPVTVRNNADAEVDYFLWPGLTASQKGSFTYKDFNGASQWYLLKDASNNWALNSAVGGLDSFKAYQPTNSGDTYVNASNATGHIRLNYEAGAGAETDIYSGGSANLAAVFSSPASIKFPGLAAASGHNCLQIDNSGSITNTGSSCGMISTVGPAGLTFADNTVQTTSEQGALTGSANDATARAAATAAQATANAALPANGLSTAATGGGSLTVPGTVTVGPAIAGYAPLSIGPGRYDVRLCDPSLWSPYSVSSADVTTVLQACINTQTAAGRSLYLPYEYGTSGLTLPPNAVLWCDSKHQAGLIQVPTGAGIALTVSGNAYNATLATQNDASSTGVEIHNCLIDGNKANIYATPSNPGNTNPISGILLEHQNAVGGHPREVVNDTLVQNTTGNGIILGPHDYDLQSENITVYGADQACLVELGVSDTGLNLLNTGQCRTGGVQIRSGSNVRLSHVKAWFAGQGIVLSCASVAASSGGTAVYTCTYPGTQQHLQGISYNINGFINAGNNGSFLLQSISGSSYAFANANAVAETPATAAIAVPSDSSFAGHPAANFSFYGSGATSPQGAFELNNLQSQDGMAGFYFVGNTSYPLIVTATDMQSDSDNYGLTADTHNSCYFMQYVSQSIIHGICGKWETGTPGIPIYATNMVSSSGNDVGIGAFGYSASVAVSGSGACLWSCNRIDVNAVLETNLTATYAAAYTPDPQLASAFTMTLTGNLLLNVPQTTHTLSQGGQTLDFYLIEDSTGGRTITLGTGFVSPAGCTFNTTPSAVNHIKAYSTDGAHWQVISPCAPAAGIPVADGKGGWTAGLPLAGTGAGIATGPASTTAGDMVCYNDTAGTQKDCGLTYSSFALSNGTSGVSGAGAVGTLSAPFPAAATLAAVNLQLLTAPAGCTTYPTLALVDTTASNNVLASVTLASATYSYPLTITSAAIALNHQLQMRVTVASAGCTTSPAGASLMAFYHQ